MKLPLLGIEAAKSASSRAAGQQRPPAQQQQRGRSAVGSNSILCGSQ